MIDVAHSVAETKATSDADHTNRSGLDDWIEATPGRRRGVAGIVLLIALSVFFRGPLLSHFTVFYGDSYDGLIEVSILQHWYNVLIHNQTWSEVGYFYPYRDTLGYNDTYFIPAIFFSLARVAGADPFLATFFSHVGMNTLGFVGAYVLLRRGANVRTWLSLAGAFLFATANVSLLHMHHAQLLSVGLVAWLAFFAIRFVQAVAGSQRFKTYKWGVGLALLYGLIAFNSFYAAWFSGFFAVVFSIVGIMTAGRARRRKLLVGVRNQILPLISVVVVTLIAMVPLLIVYLPKILEGAQHSFEHGAGSTLIYPTTLINVGRGNLIWGPLFDLTVRSLTHHGPFAGETRFGIPLGLLFTSLVAGMWGIRHRSSAWLVLAFAITLIVVVTLMIRWPGGFTLWLYVYKSVPGADAVRVISRFLLFAIVPIIYIVFTWLDRANINSVFMISLLSFLLLEEVQLSAPLGIDRGRQMLMLRLPGRPPSACKSYFVVSAQPDLAQAQMEAQKISLSWNKESPRSLLGLYRHNVDAMLLANYYDVPTINGFSTFNPPDWQFVYPQNSAYLIYVRQYVRRHQLSDVCGLDLQRRPIWFALRNTSTETLR